MPVHLGMQFHTFVLTAKFSFSSFPSSSCLASSKLALKKLVQPAWASASSGISLGRVVSIE